MYTNLLNIIKNIFHHAYREVKRIRIWRRPYMAIKTRSKDEIEESHAAGEVNLVSRAWYAPYLLSLLFMGLFCSNSWCLPFS